MKMTRIILSLSFCFALCHLASAQKIEITTAIPTNAKPVRSHFGFLGEDESNIYVSEISSKKNVTTDNYKKLMYIRAFDKKTMKQKADLLIPGVHTRYLKGEKLYVGCGLVKNHVGVVWENVDKGMVKITWYSAKTLKKESEKVLFNFGATATSLKGPTKWKDLDLVNGHVYRVRVARSSSGDAISIVAMEKKGNRSCRFTARTFLSPDNLIAENHVECETNIMKVSEDWFPLITKNGDVLVTLQIPKRDEATYKDLDPGVYVARISHQSETQKFEKVAPEAYGSARMGFFVRDNYLYMGGVALGGDAPLAYAGRVSLSDFGNHQINAAKFPPESHAKMKSPTDYEKYLQKASDGKNYFNRYLRYGGMDVTSDGNFIFTMNETKMVRVSEDGIVSYDCKFGPILVSCMSVDGTFKWHKAIDRKEKVESSQEPIGYDHDAVGLSNGKVVLLINEKVNKLDGANLEPNGEENSIFCVVTVEENGSWSKTPVPVPKHSKRNLAMPDRAYVLSDGSLFAGFGRNNYLRIDNL